MYSNSGINKVLLVGIIESAPKKHHNAQSASRVVFNLLTTEQIRKGDQPIEHHELHRIVIDEDHPDLVGIELQKGAMLHIIGKAQTRASIDNDNIKRYKTEIIVSQLTLLRQVVDQIVL